jgi:hypothetical protein
VGPAAVMLVVPTWEQEAMKASIVEAQHTSNCVLGAFTVGILFIRPVHASRPYRSQQDFRVCMG